MITCLDFRFCETHPFVETTVNHTYFPSETFVPDVVYFFTLQIYRRIKTIYLLDLEFDALVWEKLLLLNANQIEIKYSIFFVPTQQPYSSIDVNSECHTLYSMN